MTDNTNNVVIAYAHPGQTSAWFTASLCDLTRTDKTISRVVHRYSGPWLSKARNDLVYTFLDHEAEWLLMVDADMTFGMDSLSNLLKIADPIEKPIVGALCVTQQERFKPTMYRFNHEASREAFHIHEDWDYGDVEEVDATGTGFLLVHRSVYEEMKAQFGGAYPWFSESDWGGVPMGIDLTFCVKAKRMGYNIFVDTNTTIGHMKQVTFDFNQYLMQREQERQFAYSTAEVWKEEPEAVPESRFTPNAEEGWTAWNVWSPEKEWCDQVAEFCAKIGAENVLETGVGQGYVTRRIAKVAKNIRGYETNVWFRKVAQENAPPNVEVMEGHSPTIDDFQWADLVILDSEQPIRWDEMELWRKKGKLGSHMVVHDAREDHPVTNHVKKLQIEGEFGDNPRGSFFGVQGD